MAREPTSVDPNHRARVSERSVTDGSGEVATNSHAKIINQACDRVGVGKGLHMRIVAPFNEACVSDGEDHRGSVV